MDLRINDFTGGLTDNYIDGAPNCAQTLDNFIVDKTSKKPMARPGSVLYNTTYYQLPTGNQRVSAVWFFKDYAFAKSNKNLYYLDVGAISPGWQHLKGWGTAWMDGNAAFSVGSISTTCSGFEWQDHWWMADSGLSRMRKIHYRTVAAAFGLDDVGLPTPVNGAPAITATFTGGAASLSHVYYLVWTHEYLANGVTHRVVSPPLAFAATTAAGTAIGAASACALANLPVLANDSVSAYRLTELTLEIYRTTNGGTVGYYIGEVANGTTTYSDVTPDATADDADPIYIDGGAVDYDPAPACNFLALANDTGWCAYSNRVRQSVPGNMNAWPTSFYVDVGATVTALNNVGTYPIVFTSTTTTRLEGTMDRFGSGGIRKRTISDTVGCISNQGVVKVLGGLYFPALDGWYFTDGFSVQPISKHLRTTYAGLFSVTNWSSGVYPILGAYDDRANRLVWAVSTASGNQDKLFVCDPELGNAPGERCFSTWSNGAHFAPTAICFLNGWLIRGDSRGYVLAHKTASSLTMVDPAINASVVPGSWLKGPVIPDYISPAFTFGQAMARKRVVRMDLVFQKVTTSIMGETNLTATIGTKRDMESSWTPLKEVRYRVDEVISAPQTTSRENVRWKDDGIIRAKRMLPHNRLKCNYRQFRITNDGTGVWCHSGWLGAAVYNVAGTITFASDVKGLAGMYLYLAEDDYATGYLIGAYGGSGIYALTTLAGASRSLAAWYICGRYSEEFGEVMKLDEYTIRFMPLGTGDDGYGCVTG